MCAITRKKNKDTHTLSFEGELTIYHVQQLKAELLTYADECENLAVDLSNVTEVDTAGAQLVLFLNHYLGTMNKKFSVKKSNEQVDQVVDALGMRTYFTAEN